MAATSCFMMEIETSGIPLQVFGRARQLHEGSLRGRPLGRIRGGVERGAVLLKLLQLCVGRGGSRGQRGAGGLAAGGWWAALTWFCSIACVDRQGSHLTPGFFHSFSHWAFFFVILPPICGSSSNTPPLAPSRPHSRKTCEHEGGGGTPLQVPLARPLTERGVHLAGAKTARPTGGCLPKTQVKPGYTRESPGLPEKYLDASRPTYAAHDAISPCPRASALLAARNSCSSTRSAPYHVLPLCVS